MTKAGIMRAPISEYNASIIKGLVGLDDDSLHRKVIVDGKTFSSIQVAAMYIGAHKSSIRDAIIQNHTCKGHTVGYAE